MKHEKYMTGILFAVNYIKDVIEEKAAMREIADAKLFAINEILKIKPEIEVPDFKPEEIEVTAAPGIRCSNIKDITFTGTVVKE